MDLFFLAEREGFEPPVPLSTAVFKTAAIDHSAISPSKAMQSYDFFLIPPNIFAIIFQIFLKIFLTC